MVLFVESPIAFLIAATSIAAISIVINTAIVGHRLTADRAFWLAWIVLIWSGELVSNLEFLNYPYPVEPETRGLVLVIFLSATLGFAVGSICARGPGRLGITMRDKKLTMAVVRRGRLVSILIAAVGVTEFVANFYSRGNLLDLRLAVLDGEVGVPAPVLHFFYFAFAFLIVLGISDGLLGRVSRANALLSIGGLVAHNLAVGGRINLIVAPLMYFVPLWIVIVATRQPKPVRRHFREFLVLSGAVGAIVFPVISFVRSWNVQFGSLQSVQGIVSDVLLSLPRYIADTIVSVHIHVMHAREAMIPFGYYTFDAIYRLLGDFLGIDPVDSNYVFGHIYYRNSAAPFGWTQTNMIPRLIADFGWLFWLAMIVIAAVAQWGSLLSIRSLSLSVAVRSLMVVASAYSILGTFWFSAFNVYILFYAVAIFSFSGLGGERGNRESGRQSFRVG